MILLDVSSWWLDLTTLGKTLWVITIPFSVLFLFQSILTFFGGDADDGDLDSDIEFQFLTIKNLISFFTMFGWTGIMGLNSGWSTTVTILVALAAGLSIMFVMAYIAYSMSKLVEKGNFNISSTINKTATVYLSIPSNRSALGKIQVKAQGYQTLDALTDDASELSTGSIVKIVDVIDDDILLVTKL
ncbi:hypothetical protein [Saccharicrinis aurantiacus]|uniref:hypothetical protein n=1 Tax=Saccharicrinis aurantiacus TaxID=1849719 RepID=UPI000838EFB7|nr:hypothetical protein [Saccharicrinis aurantiacus]